MCEKTMFCCEPLVRESYHYAVCDEAFMKRWESEPLPAFLGDARMQGMFADVYAADIRKQFDRAVDEGWAFKADSLAELAEHFDLPGLESSIGCPRQLPPRRRAASPRPCRKGTLYRRRRRSW